MPRLVMRSGLRLNSTVDIDIRKYKVIYEKSRAKHQDECINEVYIGLAIFKFQVMSRS